MRISLALALGLSVFAPAAALADDAEAHSFVPEALQPQDGASIDDLKWTARPIVVFADSANDPRFAQQMELIAARSDDLEERDVVVFTDTDPASQSALRTKLRPRGFMMVLIGKDGGVKLRKPFPQDVREISRSIDKMPMRQREIRERRGADG